MKLIRAIIRPERERHVIQALESVGEPALTKFAATGRGRGGATAGLLNHAELARVMLLLVVEDEKLELALGAITKAAFTGFPGDGRIFVSEVAKTIELRTGEVRTSNPTRSE